MKVSFVATVFNEEEGLSDFLKSIFCQSRIPDEVIIVDGGSTDATASVISNLKSPRLSGIPQAAGQISNKKIKFKIIIKKGNRAVGRNEAVKNASNEIIVCSDAGCVLDKNWVKNITKPFENPKVDVVAGYYEGEAGNIFQKCLVPYVLVMPDKVNENEFLPATRSMAFKKSIWKKAGEFNEKYSHNEDYVFANKLRSVGANIAFEKKAIVRWMPRDNLKDAFAMFYRFAKGDSESHIFRPKVALIFLRYILGFILLLSFFLFKSYLILNMLYIMLIIYIVWSIIKNYKYVKDVRAIFLLPLIQIVSDTAVIMGTSRGIISYDRLRPNEHRLL